MSDAQHLYTMGPLWMIVAQLAPQGSNSLMFSAIGLTCVVAATYLRARDHFDGRRK